MSPYLPEIASRLLNTPLLVHPRKAEVLLWVLGPRIGIKAEALPDIERRPDASRFVGLKSGEGAYAIERGVAIIPVLGTLVNRGAWLGSYSGLTSYEGLEASLERALADDAVSRIVLDINSPGGEATGMARIVAAVRRARAIKPVVALVNDMACSAAYAIAAQADAILVSATSMVGSIGVVWVHFDHSEALAAQGVKPTILHKGARKKDGNPLEALSSEAAASIDAELEAFYAVFIDVVAESRQQLNDAALRAMEARTFTGRAAIDNGLADAMGGIEEAITMKIGDHDMSETDDLAVKAAPAMPAVAANSIPAEQHATALEAARSEGATAAVSRVQAILTSEAARGREAQAQVFAFDTGLTVEAAIKALEAAPRVEADRREADQAQSAKAEAQVIAAAKIAAAGAINAIGPDAVREPAPVAPIDPERIYAARRG